MKEFKCLYFGQFNWYGEVHKIWTSAKNSVIAHRQFIVQLARTLRVSESKVRYYFNGDKDNYKITKDER